MWPHSFDCVQPVDRAIAVRCEDEVTGMDQSRKTMRHFYCRDVLWETFEAMAADFDCSVFPSDSLRGLRALRGL